jgi:hypothetical protein
LSNRPELPTTLIEEAAQILAGVCESVELYPQLGLRFPHGVLFVHTTWRARQDQTIVGSSGPSKDRLPLLVVGAHVKSLDVKGPYHDLVLRFDNDVLLETFGDSAEYEHWTVNSLVDRRQVIAGPGSSWSAFAM